MKKLNEHIMKGYLMLANANMPFFNAFLLRCSYKELKDFPSMGICATRRGFEIAYSPEFVASLDKHQMAFVLIHEIMHGLSKHMPRTGNRDKQFANITQDMIINSNLFNDYSEKLIKDPFSDKEGEMCLIPEDYDGIQTFEKLYEWLRKNKPEIAKQMMSGSENGEGEDEKGKGKYKLVDEHLEDEITPELREAMIEDFVKKMKVRGYVTGNIESMLDKIRPKKNNYLSAIKRSLAMLIGKYKKSTWKKLSRKLQMYDDFVIKGYKKYKQKMNIILDVSGSMSGLFTKVLNYIANNNIEMNLITIDTQVQSVTTIKSIAQLQKLKIKGLGGSTLDPAVRLIEEKFNAYPTVMLTDGYIDTLNFKGIKKDFLILTTESKVDYTNASIKVKQIVIKD